MDIDLSSLGKRRKLSIFVIAMIDSHTLKKNDDFNLLPETYIIFITEHDIRKKGKPIYKVEKIIDGELYDDGVHTIYVNGSYRGNDAIGRLMNDFCLSNADEMYYTEIAERVRFHKQEEGGARGMCRAFEEYGNERAEEARNEKAIEVAKDLLKENVLPIERVAAIAKLPLEQVQKLAEQL